MRKNTLDIILNRRCKADSDVTETIHENVTTGETVSKTHSWTATLETGIVIDEIFSLGGSLTHTNSLTTGCSETHTHATDWSLTYTKPAGKKGYFPHNYTFTGSDYTLFVYASCVNTSSDHLVLHSTGATHGQALGDHTPKIRSRYLNRDVETYVVQDAECVECGTADMYCDGTNCTKEDPCCDHNK